MVNRPVPALDQYNLFHMVKQFVFTPGWVRWPLIFGGAYTWCQITEVASERVWQDWNVGKTQKEMWDEVEIRTKARLEAADKA